MNRNEMNKMDIDDSYSRVPILWGLGIDVVDVTVVVVIIFCLTLSRFFRSVLTFYYDVCP